MGTPEDTSKEPTSDVEGHARMRVTDDDVEGHLSLPPEHYLGDSDGRLPSTKGGAVKADVTDDVSGHDLRAGRTRE